MIKWVMDIRLHEHGRNDDILKEAMGESINDINHEEKELLVWS